MTFYDRVRAVTGTTGTGSIVLGDPVSGYRAFTVVGNGETVPYCIEDGNAWEIGTGTWTSATLTLTRSVSLSSSSNALLSLTGRATVFIVVRAADVAGLQPLDADLTAIAALSPVNDDIIQRKSGSWINRTPAQLKTDLALTLSDLSTFSSATLAGRVTDETGSGALVFGTSPTLSGTVTLAGGQAAFPATQSASSDANTLDDYEEGTWTPTATNLTTTVGSATIAGTYTKIGRLVGFTITITPAGGGGTTASTANSTRFTLPFAPIGVKTAISIISDAVADGGSGLVETGGGGEAWSSTWAASAAIHRITGHFYTAT